MKEGAFHFSTTGVNCICSDGGIDGMQTSSKEVTLIICPQHHNTLCGCDDFTTKTAVAGDDKGLTAFVTRDSGERQEYSTGMVRDTNKDKARYDLIYRPGLKRLAELMGRGASKYSPRNWEKASTLEELDRFKESANRHFEQWFQGDTDEDHMAAVVFNLFGAEMVKQKLKQ